MKTTFLAGLILVLSFSINGQITLEENREIIASIGFKGHFNVTKMDHLDERSHIVTIGTLNYKGAIASYKLFYVEEVEESRYQALELDVLWKDIEQNIGRYCKVGGVIYRIRDERKGKGHRLYLDQLKGTEFVLAKEPFYSLEGKTIGNFMYQMNDNLYFVHANEESNYPKSWKYEGNMTTFNVLRFDLPGFDNPMVHSAELTKPEISSYELGLVGEQNGVLYVMTFLKPSQANKIILKSTEFADGAIKESVSTIQLDFEVFAVYTASLVNGGVYALIMDTDGGVHGIYLENQNGQFELISRADLTAEEVLKEYYVKASGEPPVAIAKAVMKKQVWYSFTIKEGGSSYIFSTFGYYTYGERYELFEPHDCLIAKITDGDLEWITNVASGRRLVNIVQEAGLVSGIEDHIPKIEFTTNEIILLDIESIEDFNKEGEFERARVNGMRGKHMDMRVILNKEDGTFVREASPRN